jgi:single-stranded-DNA-specific exonuclease
MSATASPNATQRIEVRPVPAHLEAALRDGGVHPVLARLFAARGVRSTADLERGLDKLIAPALMRNAERAAALLATAIEHKEKLLIVADYDCDGATACAVGVRGLRAMGATVDYLVPDRFKLGYGLTPELVAIAAERQPDWLITVDNGIASVAGVAAANALGLRTLITDHHLPGAELPAATCIVNPNQPGCAFPSKSIAGVGVMFYVLIALRAELRRRGAFAGGPNLGALLDLVALGTVADVVRLDANNRVLVAQGLARIREGKMQPGIRALLAASGRDPRRASSFDLGFALGPRLNAAGRLADMHLGIEMLVSDDQARTLEIAQTLDRLNRERRAIEGDMLEVAQRLATEVTTLAEGEPSTRASITVGDASWHQGVVGIVAARVKDRLHRPTFVFAPTDDGSQWRGSGRSIAGFHLRDCLDLVSKLEPDLLVKFGGHAAAAGVTIAAGDLDRFSAAFETAASRMLDAATLTKRLETDGALEAQYMTHPTARLLDAEIWGQGFPAPLFVDAFQVLGQRIVGGKHLRLKLALDRAPGQGGRELNAIAFDQPQAWPERVRVVYRLGIDEYNGMESVQLIVETWEPR